MRFQLVVQLFIQASSVLLINVHVSNAQSFLQPDFIGQFPHVDAYYEAVNNEERKLLPACKELPSFPRSADVETVVSFYAMGDTPYTPEQKFCLNEQLRGLNITDGSALFQINVGDIKRGFWPCNYSAYNDIAQMYTHPNNAVNYNPRDAFFVVGDNEWTNCNRPEEAWKIWTEHFGKDNRFGFGTFSPGKNIRVSRQTGVERLPGVDRSENFAFYTKKVLFIGLNIIGGKAYGDESVRLVQNYNWARNKLRSHKNRGMKACVVFGHSPIQARNSRRTYFGDPFRALLRKEFPNLPVLYVHGDWHDYCVRELDDDNPNIWDLELEDGGFAPPVLVSILRNKKPNDNRYLFKVDQRGGLYSPLGKCRPIYETTWGDKTPKPEGYPYKILRNNQGLLGPCEGDCDTNRDCQTDLVCSEGDGPVPGCYGNRVSGKEYCHEPPMEALRFKAKKTKNPEVFPIDKCEGYCYRNTDCKGSLKCFKRDGQEEVPGCTGSGKFGKNYCYDDTE